MVFLGVAKEVILALQGDFRVVVLKVGCSNLEGGANITLSGWRR